MQEAPAQAEEAPRPKTQKPKRKTRRASKKDEGTSGKPESSNAGKPASGKGAKLGSDEAAEPTSGLADVNATTRRLVAEAGPAGIEMAQLAAQVRAAHRGFKVRDHGHAQFKSYVASLGDIEVERIGKEWFARMGE